MLSRTPGYVSSPDKVLIPVVGKEDVFQCFDPAWISEEITGSLSRLGVTTLDVVLLHSPE